VKIERLESKIAVSENKRFLSLPFLTFLSLSYKPPLILTYRLYFDRNLPILVLSLQSMEVNNMITNQKKKLIKVLPLLSVFLFPFLIIFSQKTAYATASSQVMVTAYDLNVRAAPNMSSKIISLVHQGHTFKLIQTKNSWEQIKLSSNQTGWIYNAYIKKAEIHDQTPKQASPTEKVKAKVEAVVLNVRKNPRTSSKIVGKLIRGTNMNIHEEQSGWAKIVSSTGVHGWVDERYITKEESSHHQTRVTTAAPSTKGTKGITARISDLHFTVQSNTAIKQNSQKPLQGKTIVLDPGHGGKDDGTTSIVGTHEKTLTLSTSELVEQKLKNAGAKVIMTRTSDIYIPLQQRADLANQNNADAFISFHYNWSNDPSVNGVTDFYYQKLNSLLLASYILNEVAKTTQLNNDGTRFDDLSVLRNNSQPSTLIELGFLSNKQDDSVVESSAYRDNVAQGVYLGLLDFFNQKDK
jgi:N-acetylmuramoyl-L-alanine amidase